MSTWVTPSGSLGITTTQRSFTTTLVATPTLGGVITYVLQTNSQLPSGLRLNANTGVITGVTDYVTINTTTSFTVSATETTSAGNAYTNLQSFSITVSNLVWTTPQGSIGIFAEQFPVNYQFTTAPSQSTNTVTYTQLNGAFPPGTLSLSSTGLLTGIPSETARSATTTFTVRAQEYNGLTLVAFKDRTFSMTVDIAIPNPEFTTPSGTLFAAYDSTWQYFQLQYIDQNPTSDVVITLATGTLPPGLQLSFDGLIRGYALPPVDADGNPINQTYSFTLEIASDTGRSLTSYSITINNQALIPGFVGRAPTILNTEPLSFIISADDPYAPYYLSSNDIGDLQQNTDFIFKMIGYNFDTEDYTDLTYVINEPQGSNLYPNPNTGWISGILPTINTNIETYNFTVSVYRTSNPTLTSSTFLFTATIIGDIDTQITWVTKPDLGVINNGAISDLQLFATNETKLKLNYRIVGNQIRSNLKTITATGTQFIAMGDVGAYVTGTSNGQTWTQQPSINSAVSLLYFTSSVYDPANENTIVVGYNQTNGSIIGQIPDSSGLYIPSATAADEPLRCVILAGSLFVAVGDNGTITTTGDPSIWSTLQNSGTTIDLLSVCYGASLFVAVGNNGTVLTSPDTFVWTPQTTNTTLSLRSITYTGTTFVAVGDLGIILTSTDAVTWNIITNIQEYLTADQVVLQYNLTSVCVDSVGNRVLIAGEDGVILTSIDDGISFIIVQNLITTSTIYQIIYDYINTNSFYLVGDVGTILQYNNDPLSSNYTLLSSPTLTRLPPDLQLFPTGEISGRLAFESTETIVNQGVSQVYNFSVQAYSTEFSEISSIKMFKLTTYQKYYLPYDNIYMKALMSLDDRYKINTLIHNGNLIPPEYVYRIDDYYFGVANDVTYQHIFGVPTVASDDFFQTYIDAVEINHYWRNITLGEIKTAVARDEKNNIIYEVVYSQVVDNLVNGQGVSISKEIIWPRNIDLHLNDWYDSLTTEYTSETYQRHVQPLVKTYISSTDGLTLSLNSVNDITVGMNLVAIIGSTVTNQPDGTPSIVTAVDTENQTVTVNVAQSLTPYTQILFREPAYTALTPGIARTLYPNSLPNMRQQIDDAIGNVNDPELLPLWMTSVQQDNTILGFTPAWVICYCKPGTSAIIQKNIQTQWPYTLNEIDFELDRFEVDRSKTYNYEGTTSGGVPIWNTLPSAQPNVTNNSTDRYVYFPRKTILPDKSQ